MVSGYLIAHQMLVYWTSHIMFRSSYCQCVYRYLKAWLILHHNCLYIETSQQETACEFSTHKASNDNGFISCRVAANGVIKVADFGLTEDMYQRKYFRQESNIRLPIKLMAMHWEHSRYGVLRKIWCGKQTYYKVISVAIILFHWWSESHAGNEMMLSCWKDSPQDRPTFDELVQTLSDILKPLANYMDFNNVYSKSESHTYSCC